jgi:hypothetical protein
MSKAMERMVNDMARGIVSELQYRSTTEAELAECRKAMVKLAANDKFWDRLAEYCELLSLANNIRDSIIAGEKAGFSPPPAKGHTWLKCSA